MNRVALITVMACVLVVSSGCFGYGMRIQGAEGTISNGVPVLDPRIELLNSTPCVIVMEAGTVTLNIPGHGTAIKPGETGIIGDHVATITRACAGPLCVASNEQVWRSTALMMSSVNSANISYVGVSNSLDVQESMFQGKFGARWEEYKHSLACKTGETSRQVAVTAAEPKPAVGSSEEASAEVAKLRQELAKIKAALAREQSERHRAASDDTTRQKKPKWIE